MLLCQGQRLPILGGETFPVKAPAILLAPRRKHGFINNSCAPMAVSGNFPALGVETKTVA
jgi:hypothetical protein